MGKGLLMADYTNFSAKTVDLAITEALVAFGVTSEKLEYEVVDKGSHGILGIGSRPAVIKARKKMNFVDYGVEFLTNVFKEMQLDVKIEAV